METGFSLKKCIFVVFFCAAVLREAIMLICEGAPTFIAFFLPLWLFEIMIYSLKKSSERERERDREARSPWIKVKRVAQAWNYGWQVEKCRWGHDQNHKHITGVNKEERARGRKQIPPRQPVLNDGVIATLSNIRDGHLWRRPAPPSLPSREMRQDLKPTFQ